jgi:hypothetical protein
MTPFYKQGVDQALRDLGLKTAAPVEAEEKGTPFPEKSPRINAERLAAILQQQDDTPERVYPENKRYHQFGRPVSWGHSIDLTGLDQGQQVAGVMVPSSPRG